VARTGRLRRPTLSGPHGDLNAALHDLHKGAGLPSLSDMARELRDAGYSRSVIYDAFSSPRLPAWVVVDALVEILGSRHPMTSPEQELSRFYQTWQCAVDAENLSAEGADEERKLRDPAEQEVTEFGEPVLIVSKFWLSSIHPSEIDEAVRLGAQWHQYCLRWYAPYPPHPQLFRWASKHQDQELRDLKSPLGDLLSELDIFSDAARRKKFADRFSRVLGKSVRITGTTARAAAADIMWAVIETPRGVEAFIHTVRLMSGDHDAERLRDEVVRRVK
jgi:effector-associated domain 2 (EAD2)-containing protein